MRLNWPYPVSLVKLKLTHPDYGPDIQRLAGALSPDATRHMLTALRHTGELLEKNINARLALEGMLLDWPRLF